MWDMEWCAIGGDVPDVDSPVVAKHEVKGRSRRMPYCTTEGGVLEQDRVDTATGHVDDVQRRVVSFVSAGEKGSGPVEADVNDG